MILAEQTDQRKRLGRALRPGPEIAGHRIQFDECKHAWAIDDMRVACTPIASACLTLLLKQAGQCVPFARLIAQFPGEAPVNPALYKERMKLRRLISDLRAKLWPLGMDIVSVMGVGYLLLCLPEEEERQHPSESAAVKRGDI